jgi:death-on-curing protein
MGRYPIAIRQARTVVKKPARMRRVRAKLSDEIRYPSVKELSELYDMTIRATGGEHGYLSKSNLGYILDAVKDIGERLPRKKAIVKKAAFLLYNVIVIHPFLNGNKRTGFALVEAFLQANGYELNAEEKDAYQLLLDIASGKVPETGVEDWVARHLLELKGER